jgi:hypothetical protein
LKIFLALLKQNLVVAKEPLVLKLFARLLKEMKLSFRHRDKKLILDYLKNSLKLKTLLGGS